MIKMIKMFQRILFWFEAEQTAPFWYQHPHRALPRTW
jgi:hypothetical protein